MDAALVVQLTKFSERPNSYFFQEFKLGDAQKFLGIEDMNCDLYIRYPEDEQSPHVPICFEKVPEGTELATEGSDAYIMENQKKEFCEKHPDAWISFDTEEPNYLKAIYEKDSAAVIRLEECDQTGQPL